MFYTIPEFSVDTTKYQQKTVTFENAIGGLFDFTIWCSKNYIKMIPTGPQPSFYMVNKYGEVYDDTKFILIPLIRFMLPGIALNYEENGRAFDGGEMYRYDARNNPFHPYWIGGCTDQAMIQGFNNPNQNAYKNMNKLMNTYLIPPVETFRPTIHGFRNGNTPIDPLTNIGETLITDNDGGFKDFSLQPTGSRYAQASDRVYKDPNSPGGDFILYTCENNHVCGIKKYYDFDTREFKTTYTYTISLPSESDSPQSPYVLPPLFTDLFSWLWGNRQNAEFSVRPTPIENDYKNTFDCNGAISVLTFGLQKV